LNGVIRAWVQQPAFTSFARPVETAIAMAAKSYGIVYG
jgi:hypothetical protein